MSFLKDKINNELSLIRSENKRENKSFAKKILAISWSPFLFAGLLTHNLNQFVCISFFGFSLVSLLFLFLINEKNKEDFKKISRIGKEDVLNNNEELLTIIPNSFYKTKLSEEDYNVLKKIPNEISLNESEINLLKRDSSPNGNGINNRGDYFKFLLTLLRHEKLKEKFDNKDSDQSSVKHFIGRVENQIEHINR